MISKKSCHSHANKIKKPLTKGFLVYWCRRWETILSFVLTLKAYKIAVFYAFYCSLFHGLLCISCQFHATKKRAILPSASSSINLLKLASLPDIQTFK